MRKILALALLTGAIVPGTSQAIDPCTDAPTIALADASADNPHAPDDANDYGGTVFGTGSGSEPMADIYREGTDLTGAWLSTGPDGNLRANVAVADLGAGALANVNFYVLWNYEGGDAAKSQRWASARMKGYATEFTYGYMAAGSLPTSNATFATVGLASGIVDVDSDTISIDLPLTAPDWGAPAEGACLLAVSGESRILLGSPEPLPSNPSGLRHGFVYEADFAEAWHNARV